LPPRGATPVAAAQVDDRHSLDHLVNFLDNQQNSSGDVRVVVVVVVVVTELELEAVRLLPSAHLGNHPSDAEGGGDGDDDGSALEALRAFCFARSDTKLTKVSLFECDFGQQEQATQLVAAFHTNRIVVDVAIGLVTLPTWTELHLEILLPDCCSTCRSCSDCPAMIMICVALDFVPCNHVFAKTRHHRCRNWIWLVATWKQPAFVCWLMRWVEIQ
jgi:hypothetical protein